MFYLLRKGALLFYIIYTIVDVIVQKVSDLIQNWIHYFEYMQTVKNNSSQESNKSRVRSGTEETTRSNDSLSLDSSNCEENMAHENEGSGAEDTWGQFTFFDWAGEGKR